MTHRAVAESKGIRCRGWRAAKRVLRFLIHDGPFGKRFFFELLFGKHMRYANRNGNTTLRTRKSSPAGKNGRRRHHHYQVIVLYPDGEKFARVYTDRKKAESFAKRQKRSPLVKTARVVQIR